MSVRRFAIGSAICLCIAAVVGCGRIGLDDRPLPPPSEAEARAYFARLVDLASRGDFDGFCSLGDGNCQGTLEEIGRAAMPRLRPVIVGTRVIEPEQRGDAWSSGGLVLAVCGIDGRGDPYFDEVLVFESAAGLISIGTVYWSNTLVAESSTVGGPQAPPPAACPG